MLMAPPPTTGRNISRASRRTWKVLRVGSFPDDEAHDRRAPNATSTAASTRRRRPPTPRHPGLGQPQGTAAHGEGADARDPRHRRSAGPPEGGKDTAASIPGAKLLMIEGMGHALPIPMWPQIIDAIDKHAHGAATKAAEFFVAIQIRGARRRLCRWRAPPPR